MNTKAYIAGYLYKRAAEPVAGTNVEPVINSPSFSTDTATEGAQTSAKDATNDLRTAAKKFGPDLPGTDALAPKTESVADATKTLLGRNLSTTNTLKPAPTLLTGSGATFSPGIKTPVTNPSSIS